MNEDEDIETIFSRFQTFVFGLEVEKESYTSPDHVKKILRCLPARFRPKVTAIKEANKLSLENLISSLKSHEIELEGDEPIGHSKCVALTYKEKIAKSFQTTKLEEKDPDDESVDDANFKEIAYLTKRFKYLTKKKRFPNRSSDSKTSSFKDRKDNQKGCFNCGKTGRFIVDCFEAHKGKLGKGSSKKYTYRRKLKESFMATWEMLDEDSDS